MPVTQNKKGIYSGYASHADWLAGGNSNLDRQSAMAIFAASFDPVASSGLSLVVQGGPYQVTPGVSAWLYNDQQTLTLADNATNYVERDASYAYSSNTTGFTVTKKPVGVVPTINGQIDWINVEDWRPELGPTGARGAAADPLFAPPVVASIYDNEFLGTGDLSSPWTRWNDGTHGVGITTAQILQRCRLTARFSGSNDFLSGWAQPLLSADQSKFWRIRMQIAKQLSQEDGVGPGIIAACSGTGFSTRLCLRDFGGVLTAAMGWGKNQNYGNIDDNHALDGLIKTDLAWFQLRLASDRTFGYDFSPDGVDFTNYAVSPQPMATWLGGVVDTIGLATFNDDSTFAHFRVSLNNPDPDDPNGAWI